MPGPNSATAIDINDPQTLIAMINELKVAPRFLIDTYFPCNPDTDIFHSDEVLIDYDTQSFGIAPFIKSGAVNSNRDTFYTDKFSPARIAEFRAMTVDDLKKRGFSEAVFSGLAPDQREAAIAARDMRDLIDRITRTQELMAANCLQDDAYTCVYVDKDGQKVENGEVSISFHDNDSNPSKYVPGKPWDSAESNILGDLRNMSRVLTRHGCVAADIIAGSDASELIQRNAEIQKLFDNRRFEMGTIDPKLQESGAIVIGFLNVDGVLIRVLQYMREYQNATNVMTPFIAPGKCIMTAPGAGKTLYASVTQMDTPNTYEYTTHAEKFVPKITVDQENDRRKLIMSSRPLLVPKKAACWVSADVTTPAESV